jgi:ribonuclease PH
VANSKDNLIEVQSTAEGSPFTKDEFDEMLEKAMAAISELIDVQKSILSQKP